MTFYMEVEPSVDTVPDSLSVCAVVISLLPQATRDSTIAMAKIIQINFFINNFSLYLKFWFEPYGFIIQFPCKIQKPDSVKPLSKNYRNCKVHRQYLISDHILFKQFGSLFMASLIYDITIE